MMRQFISLLLISGALSAVSKVKRQVTVENERNWWEVEGQSFDPSSIANVEQSISRTDEFGSHSVTGDGVGQIEVYSDQISSDECEGPNSVCVPYYQCINGTVNTDGTRLIDIRVGSICPRYLDVCCRTKVIANASKPIEIYEPTCGRRNSNGVGVTLNGFNITQSQFGEFPWMTAVLRVENIGNEEVNLYLCGGSLIRDNVVLTAAHCVNAYKSLSMKVRAGEWDTQSEYEPYPHQDRIVHQVIIHPDFNKGSLVNDYALLILDSPFDLAPNVDTICLPSYKEVFEEHICHATGWGKDQFGNAGRFQNILKQVSLDIVDHTSCEAALQTTRLGNYFRLDNSFLCAGGYSGVDTCKGDGGSPLVCAKPNSQGVVTYYQAGIVAWGIGCGEEGIPGVYADVTYMINWIENELI